MLLLYIMLFFFFFKKKRGLELVFLPHFLHEFWRKIFLSYSINWPNFIEWLLSVRTILSNMCIVWYPGCDVMNFKINLIFLIKPFFYMTKKSRQKCKHLENEKSFRDEIKKHFLSFLRDFQLPILVSDLRVRL